MTYRFRSYIRWPLAVFGFAAVVEAWGLGELAFWRVIVGAVGLALWDISFDRSEAAEGNSYYLAEWVWDDTDKPATEGSEK